MEKLKIFFNEPIKQEPYGGAAHFVKNLALFLHKKGHKIVYNLEKNIDLIIIISNSKYLYKQKTKILFKYKKKNKDVKIIHRINNCNMRKNSNDIDKLIFKSNQISDKTVFVSNWLAEYFIKKGFDKEFVVIYNGCNRDFFYPTGEKKDLANVVNCVTHHWSNHWLKGFDIYNKIDLLLDQRKDLTFTYIGNYNKNLRAKNIKIIPSLYGSKLGNELRKADVYITASRWEPGGNHYIEGACCGLPVLYHRDGGGTNESCEKFGLEYFDMKSLLNCIAELRNSYSELRRRIPYSFLSTERCCQEYLDLIQSLYNR